MPSHPKSVLTFSGGMDSATLLYYLLSKGHSVIALSLDYGQRHRIELASARRIAKRAGVPHIVADLRGITGLLRGSSLTDPSIAVPHGHYAAENMKLTVVPNRNMLLLATATALAVSEKAEFVAYAAHAGDHTIYPDCRPAFADAMAKAIGLCDFHRVRLLRPFVGKTKAAIARLGQRLGVPYELTWSCYEGKRIHCGACGTCIERREAFAVAGVADPTVYDKNAPALAIARGKTRIDWTHTLTGEPRRAVELQD